LVRDWKLDLERGGEGGTMTTGGSDETGAAQKTTAPVTQRIYGLETVRFGADNKIKYCIIS